MSKPVVPSLDALALKLAKLALLAPQEFKAVETLVDAALTYHQRDDRAKRRTRLHPVK
jgi:hypothetical protein